LTVDFCRDLDVLLEVLVDLAFLDGSVSLLIFCLFNPQSDPVEGPSSLLASFCFLFFNLSATSLSIASLSSRIESMSA
nr:hypothetical protein [Tanacetum cinerariifolium]